MPVAIRNLEPHLIPELREVVSLLPPVAIGANAIRRERRELAILSEQAGTDRFVDAIAPGLPGQPEVRLQVYRPRLPGLLPALVWMHGGAWSLGVPEFDEPMLQRFAEQAGCFVVAVDYRLAPEHPFPAALLDCEAALHWTLAHAAERGIDPALVCLGGSSAGANLAAGLCLKLRDDAGPRPALQVMMYPALDNALDTPSMEQIADPRTITREFMRDRWRVYLGESGHESPYAVPARASDLAGLPRALILAAELDPLRDEAIAYASRLYTAAVGCELHVLHGAIHGFDAFVPKSALAALALGLVIDNLRRLAAPPPSQRDPAPAAPTTASAVPG